MTESSPNFLTCDGVPELPASVPQPLLTKNVPRHSKRRAWIIVMLLVAFFLPFMAGVFLIGYAALTMKTTLTSVQEKIVHADFVGAQMKLQEARALAQSIETGVAATLFWQYIPGVGGQLRALDQSVVAMEQTIEGALSLLHVAENLEKAFATVDGFGFSIVSIDQERSFRDLSQEERRFILANVSQAVSEARVARDKIAMALDAWDRASYQEFVGPIKQAIVPQVKRLRALHEKLDQAIPLAEILLPLVGYPEEKSYLVLLQNADELRPTGGFIGNIGFLKTHVGEIEQFFFQDVYAIDGAVQDVWVDEPPMPLKRYLGVNAWFLRDRNWSPDFPTSAKMVLDTFSREASLVASSTIPEFDGVMALQPKFFEELLKLVGPLTVRNKTFTSRNFFDQLEYDVEIGYRDEGIPPQQRKEIVAEVGHVLKEAIFAFPINRWQELLGITERALHQKNILLYMKDPHVMSLIDAHRWSGRIEETDQDFLSVIDANLGAFKTDGVMEKMIKYELDATDAKGAIATVTLTYKNTNPHFTWRYTRYRDYVRVYVPEGSELISSHGTMLNDISKTGRRVVPGNVDVGQELGKTVFGTFWPIEPGETRTLQLKYRLPRLKIDQTQSRAYTLLVQREPGARTGLTFDLKFDKNLLAASPREEEKEFGDARYRFILSEFVADQIVELKF